MSKTIMWVWVSLLCVLIVPKTTPDVTVLAQTELELKNNQAFVDFPESVDFRLQAASATSIDSVQIEYGIEMLACGTVTAVATPQFSPGNEIDLTWRWNLLEETFIPPGSQIWWRWHITDEQGATYTTETETAVFLDSWFVWQTVEAENISVHWYRGSRQVGEQVLAAALDAVEQLASDTNLRLTDPIHIYLYDESFDLQASLPGAPAWAGGAAFPEHNIVLVTANEDYLSYALSTTRHEIGHLVIGHYTFNCTNNLPTWLNEGLAMVAEGETDAVALETLETAVNDNRLLSIPQLEGSFSIDPDRAHLSYAQSYSLVNYLIDTYGADAMLSLLETFRSGVTPEKALVQTYDHNLIEIEDEWRLSIGANSRPKQSANAVSTPVPTLALLAPQVTETAVATPFPSSTPTFTIPDSEEKQAPATAQVANLPTTPTRIALNSINSPAENNQSPLKIGVTVTFIGITLAVVLIYLRHTTLSSKDKQ